MILRLIVSEAGLNMKYRKSWRNRINRQKSLQCRQGWVC